MGEEIATTTFTPQDRVAFDRRLANETRILENLFARGGFSDTGFNLGFEIEAWLVDHGFFPSSINQAFLSKLNHPLVVPELSRFNVELNCTPLPLKGRVFRQAGAEFHQLWDHCNEVAHTLDANMVMIGTLPTIRETDLTLANMSPMKRYYALNNEVLRQRRGKPLHIDIAGREHLIAEHGDVMLEAAATSFQIHLKTPASLAHRYFNASIMASGPLLAGATNAPFLFGKCLWEESRIPLFEQAVELEGHHEGRGRVSFGSGYAEDSLLEILQENLTEYPVLLPFLFDQSPQKLRHVRLHNGTIWRWNRPLIGFEDDGTPHLRIEHRIPTSGPSFLDMMANAALYIGLIHHMVEQGFDRASGLSFEAARANFYAAARDGLAAMLTWPGVGAVRADRLLLDSLVPAAYDGLVAFGVDEDEAEFHIGVIIARLQSSQTGSAWQRRHFERNGHDFFELMAAYCERQRSGAPVHEWDA